MAPKSDRKVRGKRARNSYLTPVPSGGGGGVGYGGFSGAYIPQPLDLATAIAGMKELCPAYNGEEVMGTLTPMQFVDKVVCDSYRAMLSQVYARECLLEYIGEHDALKNSYEQLKRVSYADKEKIKDLEKKLEDLGDQVKIMQNLLMKAGEEGCKEGEYESLTVIQEPACL